MDGLSAAAESHVWAKRKKRSSSKP